MICLDVQYVGEKKNRDDMVGDICQDCASAILTEDEFDLGIDDFS
jgi:hypothetical protein